MKSGVAEDVHFELIIQKDVIYGDGSVVMVKIFSALSIGYTPVSLSWCGEGGFRVAIGGSVGYHSKNFKEVISIGVYLEGRHETVHVVVRRFFGDNVCMCLADRGPVRTLVGKVTEILAFESLDLAKVPRLPLAIVGMYFAAGWTIVIILSKDNGTGECV